MKLRIAQFYSDKRMAGEFVIQKRYFLFWWTLATEITDGGFNSLQDARVAVADHRKSQSKKSPIIHIYDAEG